MDETNCLSTVTEADNTRWRMAEKGQGTFRILLSGGLAFHCIKFAVR